MKRFARILCLILCLALLPAGALADHMYLIEDSAERMLTEAELWEWDRESLTYIFNEIFARHGYVFQAGSRYDLWFRAMPWYTPNVDPNNDTQVYPKLTKLEWDNYRTIKYVLSQMDALHEPSHLEGRRCYTDYQPPRGDLALTGFSFVSIRGDQNLAVYSAPSFSAWRGANGKAAVNTNGAVWAAGWENGWLLVFYETNNGSVRVGYVNGADIAGGVTFSLQLQLDRKTASVVQPCALTDDPLLANITMRPLAAGEQVTYLTTMINQNGQVWDYVETLVDGRTARGFVPHQFLDVPQELPQIPEGYSI